MAPRLESLFGVAHGGQAASFDGEQKEIFAEPSEALARGLKELAPGSRVGIEYHPHLALPFSVYGQTLTFSPSTISYWTHLDKLCRGLGLDVVYLDDVKLSIESAKHRLLSSQSFYLAEEMEGHANPDYSSDDNRIQIQETLREAYCHDVVSWYILAVEREDKIVKNIAQGQLDTAIIGNAHGNMFLLHPEKLQRKGLEIGTYRSETLFGPMKVLAGKNEIDTAEDVSRKLLERRYTAVMNGRINPSRTPQYVGYYLDAGKPPEAGVFEVYVTRGESFSGTIIDGLGDAKIMPGRITDKEVVFAKIYEPKRSSPLVGDRRPIIYRGTWDGSKYVGNYQIGQYTNDFVMQRFSKNKQLFTPGMWRR